MRLVVDTNIIIALLINPSKTAEIFFSETLDLYAPKFLLKELGNNLGIIRRKTNLEDEDVVYLINRMLHKISFVSGEEFLELFTKANSICPDIKDVQYFASALYLKCAIWSNEKRLKQQNKIEVYATHDLIKMLAV